MEKYICIHGHYYQPPRENAWLEEIEVQDSAHPYHDWNERISAECYAPNTASRILNGKGVIKNIINNYSRISFNFGPTLLSWMEEHDPETYKAILEADRESMKRFSGHGSAIAQVYNHMIMPLANAYDKETQVIWGIRDFEHRFKRKPEGMWLAETAVDLETLELLVKYDIKYTILAPRQARAFRKIGANEEWQLLKDRSIDTRRPYLTVLPSGKSLTLFFYDGNISQAVAFSGLLYDGKKFAHALLDAFDNEPQESQLVHIATDGETYGHHHKHGDMALAYCLDYIDRHKHSRLTNYGEFLEKVPPTYEAVIHENSSWSCVHGIERWKANCGCNTGRADWHQNWRAPLREALNWLRDKLTKVYHFEASLILKDPWIARNEYISIILSRTEENIQKFMKEHCHQDVPQNRVMRLLEMQRHAMLMFTSCGWFFDEVSGIETTQILQYSCRAIQLARQIADASLEDDFIKMLELAPSNVEGLYNAAEIYRRYVLPAKTNLERVGMHYAVASLFKEDPDSLPIFNYTTKNEFFLRKEAGEQRLVVGITMVKSNVTRTEKKFAFAVVYMGKHNIIGSISLEMQVDKFTSMQVRIVNAFEEGKLGEVIGLMQTYFGPDNKYTLWHLFKDEKRKVLDMITQQSLEELEYSLRRVFNRDYPLVTALDNNDIPIPNAYRTTFEYVLNADLINAFQSERLNIKEIQRVFGELVKWKLEIEDPGKVERLAGERIFKELKRISFERTNIKRIDRLNRIFPLLKTFGLRPNLYKSQNLYFEISKQEDLANGNDTSEWVAHFNQLGENLGVKVEL